jgi:hypothetical protein
MQQLYPSLKTAGYGDDLVNCPRNSPSLRQRIAGEGACVRAQALLFRRQREIDRHRSLDKRESIPRIGAGLAKVSQAIRHREYQMR